MSRDCALASDLVKAVFEAGTEVTHDNSDTPVVELRLVRGHHVAVRKF